MTRDEARNIKIRIRLLLKWHEWRNKGPRTAVFVYASKLCLRCFSFCSNHHSTLSSSSLSLFWTLLSRVLSAGLSGRVLFDFHSIVISNCPWRCQWRSVSRTSSFVCLYLQDPNFTASCFLSTPDHNSWTFQYWRVSVPVNSSAKIQIAAVPILTPLTLFVILRHISLLCLCNSWFVI